MIDYTYLYRRLLGNGPWQHGWDVYVSSYDMSKRATTCFLNATANVKSWLVLPEYGIEPSARPPGAFVANGSSEAEVIAAYLDHLRAQLDVSRASVCIDATGFIVPYLLVLMRMLVAAGVRTFDVLYAEPDYYSRKEHTDFALREPIRVRQIEGYEGTHGIDVSNDTLILGVGYNDKAIAFAAEHKAKAKKHLLYGLPSLQADMYQESVLRVRQAMAAEALGPDASSESHIHFAPANDPFATATVLRDIVSAASRHRAITNLYLAPLATKAQAVGFALYWLAEWQGKAASVLCPVYERYPTGTAEGITKVWRYSVVV